LVCAAPPTKSARVEAPLTALRIILWDVMDTLVRDPFREVMPAFFGMTLQQMLELKHPHAWARFERGELSEVEFLATFFADGRGFDQAGFRDAIRESYAWLDGMHDLLRGLAARGYAMHALSNYPVWYEWIEERLQLSRYLSWSFGSCRLGLRKPDPAIFERAAQELRVPAAACLLVDDRLKNCEAARSVGMHALEFRGASLLAQELRGLLPEQQGA
jgi:FMN hydrolase / 5-amino-6-(5-phospho-D-ribitylamino)uracil phosphatase